MPTYRKPEALLSKGKVFSDFEMENGINKRIHCLTAFTVLALILALVALSLAGMLVFQTFQTAEMEATNIAALQQRVKELEHQVGSNSSFHNASRHPAESPSNELPGPYVEKPSIPVRPTHTSTLEEENHPIVPPIDPTTLEEEHVDDTVVHEEPVEPKVKFVPHDDDDEDHEGSGDDDCPVYSRPICPIGFGICDTNEACPKPVCCPVG